MFTLSDLKKLSSYLFIIIILCGCEGGDGSSNGSNASNNNTGGSNDSTYPTATIDFPHIDGLVTRQGNIIIRGSASDNEAVKSVSVNGVMADSTSNVNFSSWQAEVPLESFGKNTLTVKVEDVNGNISQAAATRIVNANIPNNYNACGKISYDPENHRVIGSYPDIVETDLNTGNQTHTPFDFDIWRPTYNTLTKHLYGMDYDGNIVLFDYSNLVPITISEQETNGVSLTPGEITIDSSNNMLYISDTDDPYNWYIASVDLSSGARKIIADKSTGSEDDFHHISGIEARNGRLFAITRKTYPYPEVGYLIEVDLNTGERSIISGGIYGTGYPLNRSISFTVDDTAEFAYIGDSSDELIEVNISTGERRLVSEKKTYLKDNLVFGRNIHLTVDSANESVYLSCSSNQLISIDIESGVRKQITQSKRGDGPPIGDASSVRFDSINNKILIINETAPIYMPEIMEIDPVSGDRKIIVSDIIGSGISPESYYDFALDAKNGRIFITHSWYDPEEPESYGYVVEVDRATGDRAIISGLGTGTGFPFGPISDIEIDEEKGILYVLSRSDRGLFSVDISNGNRTVISRVFEGYGHDYKGPDWSDPSGMVLSSNKNFAYVADRFRNSIFLVNLTTGYREIISSDDVGEGPSLAGPFNMRLDSTRNKLIVNSSKVSGDQPMIYVDIETGNREYRYSNNASTKNKAIVDPNTGLTYISTLLGEVRVYDYETSQALTVSK
ncbi:hypothetical protein [Microbulbifer sp. TRSA005]|uniref:hypothetical protein n=1 Tax=Microbulbifer sp. TRSA005 TaxID=3243383 RepID=UPI00403901C1